MVCNNVGFNIELYRLPRLLVSRFTYTTYIRYSSWVLNHGVPLDHSQPSCQRFFSCLNNIFNRLLCKIWIQRPRWNWTIIFFIFIKHIPITNIVKVNIMNSVLCRPLILFDCDCFTPFPNELHCCDFIKVASFVSVS